jgi:hypothetical protein
VKAGAGIALISTACALLAAAVAYSSRLNVGDEPAWLVNWALEHKSALAIWLFALSSLVAIVDWFRNYLERRHQSKQILDKVLNELSKTLFPGSARSNRVSLLNQTKGWRIFLWGLVRLPLFSSGRKWRALWRLKWRSRYLGVYLRPTDSRGPKSTSAFRVSDISSECEGVAGLVWDCAGQKMLMNLPEVDVQAIRAMQSSQELQQNQSVREYAATTNVDDIRLLKACDHFARHFYGTLIRKSDGSPWGVLLLDSIDVKCPFEVNGNPSDVFMQRFNDYARVIGKIVG